MRAALGTKLPLEYEFLGAQDVKNIKEPVRAYHARLKPDAVLPVPSTVPKPAGPSHYSIGAAVIAALVIGVAAVFWFAPWKGADKLATAVEPTVSRLQDERTIAVVPFENVSGEPDQTYFSDGITDDLITDLTKISRLLVIDRDSSFAYRGGSRDIREVARELNVRYVLHGSVRRAGGFVRVNAQLTDAAAGHAVWAERYDGEMSNVFRLQDSITKDIVSALAVKLSPGERQTLARQDTNNLEAYE